MVEEYSATTKRHDPEFLTARARNEEIRTTALGLLRLGTFAAFMALLVCGFDFAVNRGLQSMDTSIYGVTNRLMQGKINAQVVITGSSRAASHYDPRIISAETRLRAFNLGRNGSQTDMQLAVLETYLKHNRRPLVVVHNLDGFSFETTREVYNAAQYVPYLSDSNLYEPLRRIDPEIWKSRYVPLYGYVAEDMSFAWLLGLKALIGWYPRETLHDGFDPRPISWSDEFERFKAENPHGIRWPVEPEGVRLVNKLAEICRENKSRLVLVYSPEFTGIQSLTLNRKQIFSRFREMAARNQLPLWDYSDWKHAGDTAYFANSEHLNATGAKVFSEELGAALKRYLQSDKAVSRPVSSAPMERKQTS
jgi:hypothetical protein